MAVLLECDSEVLGRWYIQGRRRYALCLRQVPYVNGYALLEYFHAAVLQTFPRGVLGNFSCLDC